MNDGSGAPTSSRGGSRRQVKACVMCHKSKRRCSSTYPCENCEATGKDCVYADSNGKDITSLIPRASTPAPSALSRPARMALMSPRPQSTRPTRQWSFQMPSWPSQSDTLNMQARACRDLVNLFFLHVHPYSTMFHQPTFLEAHSYGRIPLYLVNAMYAATAPVSPYDNSEQQAVAAWRSGTRFAQASINLMVDPLGRINSENFRGQELELAQALCLLSFQDAYARRSGSPYLRFASEILSTMGVPEWGEPRGSSRNGSQNEEATKSAWRRRESHRRTLWVIRWLTMIGTAMAMSDTAYKSYDQQLLLPIDEASFGFCMLDNVTPEPFELPLRPSMRPTNVSAFGHLVRVSSIYCGVVSYLALRMELSRRRILSYGGTSSSMVSGSTNEFWALKESLVLWEETLPSHLHHTDANVNLHTTNLQLGVSNGEAWAFAFSHCLRNCATLALHAALETDGDRSAIGRHSNDQKNAYNAIISILGRFRSFVRTSIFSCTILMHIGGYGPGTDLLSASRGGAPFVQQLLRDFEDHWGVGPSSLLSLDFRTQWVRNVLSISGPGSG